MPTAPAVSRAPALLLAACALLSSSAFAGLPNLELHFNSTPPRVVTTSCAPVSLTLTDRTGGGSTSYTVSLAAVPDDLAVDFFTDSSCNTAPVSSIPASVNGATFYLRARDNNDRFAALRASLTVGADSAFANLPVQIGDRDAAAMTIVGDFGAGPPVGGCSAYLGVAFTDKNTFPVMGAAGAQPLSVKLTSSSSGVTFYSDPHCQTPATEVLAVGNVAPFAYKGTAAGSFNISAAVTGVVIPSVTRSVQVASSTGPSARISFVTAPQIIPARSDVVPASSCSAPFILETQSGAGARATAAETLNVALSATQGGSVVDHVSFFSDPECKNPVTSTNALKFDPGASTVTFYANAARTAVYKVIATINGTAQYVVGQPAEVAPGALKKLVFIKQPGTFISGQLQLAGFPIKLTGQDADGNPTQLPVDVALSVTQASEATIAGATPSPLKEGLREVIWNQSLTLTGTAGSWEQKTLSLTATLPLSPPLTAQSDAFLLLAQAPPTPKFSVSTQSAARCETIKATLSYVDALAQSADVFRACLDTESTATIESTNLTQDPNDSRCLFGTLDGGKEIIFKNVNAQSSSLTIWNSLKTVAGARLALVWTDSSACGTPAVGISVTLDKESPMLGEEVLVDIRAKRLDGRTTYAKAIKLVGGSLAIKELVDSSGAVTLFAPDELRFASSVPDTIRLKATVTAAGEFVAIALDDNDAEIGKSDPRVIQLQTPDEPVHFGCSTSGGSYALLTLLLLCALLLSRRAPAAVTLLRGPRRPRTSRR